MASRMFWHVPALCWHAGIQAAGSGNQNVLRDIVVSLISTNPPSNSAVPDDLSNFTCKRVVGQYLLIGNEPVAQQHMIHNRVYPTTSDNAAVAIRDLDGADDAESDFLWHKVEPWPSVFNSDLWGNWQTAGNAVPPAAFRNGRMGDVDITVNRTIQDGQDLIWHTQIAGSNAPADDEFDLFLWLRMLVSEKR